MKSTIWKYKIPLGRNEWGKFELMLPKNSTVLSVKKQHSDLYFWVEIDMKYAKELEPRIYWKIGTGKPFNAENLIFHKTVIDDPFVWHFYSTLYD